MLKIVLFDSSIQNKMYLNSHISKYKNYVQSIYLMLPVGSKIYFWTNAYKISKIKLTVYENDEF